MSEMFKKSDIKTGMFGKMSDGDLFVVVNDLIVYKDDGGYDEVSCMDDDLRFFCYGIDYLVEATSFQNAAHNITERRDLIWERNPPKKIPTMLEVFYERNPNAPLDNDGETPRTCPQDMDTTWADGHEYDECPNCKACWNRPVPNAKEVV